MFNEADVKQYLLSKPHTALDFPFGKDVSVFKVKGKMFATLALGKISKQALQSDDDKQSWWLRAKISFTGYL
mgnify:CR=1 FL=1